MSEMPGAAAPETGASPLGPSRPGRDRLGIGWVLVWTKNPDLVRYLADVGFRLDYRADGVAVYRPRP